MQRARLFLFLSSGLVTITAGASCREGVANLWRKRQGLGIGWFEEAHLCDRKV